MRVYQTIRRLPYLVNTLQKYDGKNDKMIRDVFTKPFEVGKAENESILILFFIYFTLLIILLPICYINTY